MDCLLLVLCLNSIKYNKKEHKQQKDNNEEENKVIRHIYFAEKGTGNAIKGEKEGSCKYDKGGDLQGFFV